MTQRSGYGEVERAVKASEYGQILSANVRYDKYRHPSVSPEEWVALLGRDVSNMEHMPLTRGIAQIFIRHSQQYQPELLEPNDEFVLPLAGSIHDIGEAIATDKSYGDKTSEDEAKEIVEFDKALDIVFAEEYPPHFQAAKDIVFDHKGLTERGKKFFAIECLGYMRTAMNAMDHVLYGTCTPEQIAGLQWLYTDVVTNMTVKMIKQAEHFDATRTALIANIERIDTAHGLITLNPDVFKNYAYKGENEPARMKRESEIASEAWREFRESILVAN